MLPFANELAELVYDYKQQIFHLKTDIEKVEKKLEELREQLQSKEKILNRLTNQEDEK